MRGGVIGRGSLGVWVMTHAVAGSYTPTYHVEKETREEATDATWRTIIELLSKSRQRDVRRGDGVPFEGGVGETRRAKAS